MKIIEGKYILISGSASRSCPDEKLETAILLHEACGWPPAPRAT